MKFMSLVLVSFSLVTQVAAAESFRSELLLNTTEIVRPDRTRSIEKKQTAMETEKKSDHRAARMESPGRDRSLKRELRATQPHEVESAESETKSNQKALTLGRLANSHLESNEL